ncbi:MAG: hypothetical protein C7B45_07135 [Sulfobacillus acidophilus]|uniref:FAD dependent oxidoreductase domain-containing protein n=1 Tax=Sulfobacillus acidophilus TaxID=53633 RepID=A0A2T2WJH8_9FIRM|nr:MAG: hypothetical protein C7B45_07135 [Sulfobacillus acidophilus]
MVMIGSEFVVSNGKAIVVGGGVVGCAVALALNKQGWTVSLWEQGQIFSQTSSRAAGFLGFEAEAYGVGGHTG